MLSYINKKINSAEILKYKYFRALKNPRAEAHGLGASHYSRDYADKFSRKTVADTSTKIVGSAAYFFSAPLFSLKVLREILIQDPFDCQRRRLPFLLAVSIQLFLYVPADIVIDIHAVFLWSWHNITSHEHLLEQTFLEFLVPITLTLMKGDKVVELLKILTNLLLLIIAWDSNIHLL